MRDLAYNLDLLESMFEEFDEFLLSKESFWPLGSPRKGGGPFPRLSLGQVLLTRDEVQVQAEEMGPRQSELFSHLERRWQEIQSQRPANLEKKALGEVSQRLNLWKAYVQELRETGRAAQSYSTDVRHRVLLTRLQAFIDDERELDTLNGALGQLDKRLRGVFRSGAFVWHPRLVPLYDEQDYWFLYGKPAPRG